MKTATKTLSILVAAIAIVATGLLATPAYSAVVLLEDFNDVGTTTWADIGWTGVNNAGGTITGKSQTNHVSFPPGPYMDPTTTIEGNGRLWGHSGTAWFVTDAPALSAIDQIRWLDLNTGKNYRIGLEVGGQWYLSDLLSTSSGGGFDPGDGAHPGVTLTDFSSGFSLWGVGTASTGAPADDTEAWDLSTLGSSGALPSGTITRIGWMNVSTDMRGDYFEVSGTEVPEPASLAMGLVGLTMIAGRRRRSA
jgi:MYXO-CTERM domain-containing protein